MSDEKKSVTISFVTTPTMEEALRKAATEQDRSVSWVIGKALETYLTDEGHLKKLKSADR